jgi:hypothetical protein
VPLVQAANPGAMGDIEARQQQIVIGSDKTVGNSNGCEWRLRVNSYLYRDFQSVKMQAVSVFLGIVFIVRSL